MRTVSRAVIVFGFAIGVAGWGCGSDDTEPDLAEGDVDVTVQDVGSSEDASGPLDAATATDVPPTTDTPDADEGDALTPDADAGDASAPDGDTADVADDGDADTTDADTTDADTTDAADDGGRTPGTVPIDNYIGCDDDSECPTGTGNCVTSIPFNRVYGDSPSRITITELAPGWPRAGVCTRTCSDQTDACDGLRLPGAPDTAFACQIVATGTAPYALVDGALPDPAGLDPEQQTLGQPFAALCLPPFRATTGYSPDFCESCTAEAACEAGSVCWLDAPFSEDGAPAGACLTPCDGGEGACPIGFACEALDAAEGTTLDGVTEGTFCMPLERTCGACRDADADGFGTGLCAGNAATPHDCADTVPYAWFDATDMTHAFPLICGAAEDANCNGIGDLFEQAGTEAFGTAHCTACDDACGGAAPNGERVCLGGVDAATCGVRCTDPSAFVDCDGEAANGCETAIDDPARVFYADCDGDGVPRDVWAFACVDAPTYAFDVDGERCEGIASSVLVRDASTGEIVFDCDDNERENTPGGLEVCDGQDNDCNDVVDDTPLLLSGPLGCTAPGVLGECAVNGTWACGADGSGPAEVCVPAAPSAETCDGLDNDCDGAVDNPAIGVDGSETPVVARPDALQSGTVGDRCTDESGERLGICAAGALVCDSEARELDCAYDEPSAGPGGLAFEARMGEGVIPPAFDLGEPAWQYGCEDNAPCGLVSPSVGDLEQTTLTLPLSVARDGRLGFTYFVSSERTYDVFEVLIDDVLVFGASGEVGEFASVDITAGDRVVEFRYRKDRSVANGRDNVVLLEVLLILAERLDWPGDATDEDCDGFDGSLSEAIFVGGVGAVNAGDGDREAPYETLDYALREALRSGGAKSQIYVQGGATISAQFDIPSTFGIYGGYNEGFADATGRSTIEIGEICGTGSPCISAIAGGTVSYTAGLVARAPADIRLDRLDVTLSTQTTGFGPAAVLACERDCGKLQLTNVSLTAASGPAGDTAAPYVEAAVGGLESIRPSTTVTTSDTRARPSLTCRYDDGTTESRTGGLMGGRGDATYRQSASPHRYPGTSFGGSGGRGDSGLGGAGGVVALNGAVLDYCAALNATQCADLGVVRPGASGPSYADQAAGRAGSDGSSGAIAREPVSNLATPWAVLNGRRGPNGVAGRSGGGGGGTSTHSLNESWDCACFVTCATCTYSWLQVGSFGESGATGGCGGNGGREGGAGGTAIGLVVRGDAFPSVDGVRVVAQSGGAGGAGGVGQAGGAGGERAAGDGFRAIRLSTSALPLVGGTESESEGETPTLAYLTALITNAGRGGVGGDGGGGGGGTGGAGGWSIAVLTYGAEVPTGTGSGLDLGVPTTVAVGGAGGAGGQAGGDSELPSGVAGRAGLSGDSCQIWNAVTNVGTTCASE